ncbi:MAG: bacteriorhodopsin [Pseudomonadales bacterium]|jgi:bacteriorhodopsin|nr:bacteriorhodopsin [Pseudomonadales bacterium]MDA0761192.1 bacteriorhodopsin [Pseudomonadota bacterium]MDA0958763.1 bacteriorhodopsin [Pseudomonadota bacterium]
MQFLASGDLVGVSFWIVSVAMIASTVFFLYEGLRVKSEWRLSMLVAGLVTLVAAVHYDYMRDYWVLEQSTPIVYRYIDWLITVPLLMIEFWIILKAVGSSVGSGSFIRLLVGTLVMLIFGYLGEAGVMNATLGFWLGMVGWAVIIYEIFAGEAGKAAAATESVKAAFGYMRLIVLVGWAIYPIGYVMGYMMGGVDEGSLNMVYNLADFVNKILFGLIIWNLAYNDSAEGGH